MTLATGTRGACTRPDVEAQCWGVEISGQLGRAMLEVMDLSFTRAGNDMDVRLELGNPSAVLIQALN